MVMATSNLAGTCSAQSSWENTYKNAIVAGVNAHMEGHEEHEGEEHEGEEHEGEEHEGEEHNHGGHMEFQLMMGDIEIISCTPLSSTSSKTHGAQEGALSRVQAQITVPTSVGDMAAEGVQEVLDGTESIFRGGADVHHEHDDHDDECGEPSTGWKWFGALGMAMVISIMSGIIIIFLPFCAVNSYVVISLIGLAIGALIGDSFFHLVPGMLGFHGSHGGGHGDEHGDDHGDDHGDEHGDEHSEEEVTQARCAAFCLAVHCVQCCKAAPSFLPTCMQTTGPWNSSWF